MGMEKKNNTKSKEANISENPVTIHINYNESLTLRELSIVLDLINIAINDVNRDNGIKSTTKLGKDYAAQVAGVDSGSIILHILTRFAAPVALGVLADFLYDRLKTIGAKKEKSNGKSQINPDTAYPISINVNGNDNIIEITITKPSNNDAA